MISEITLSIASFHSPIIKQQWQQDPTSVGKPGGQALLSPWSESRWAEMFGVNTRRNRVIRSLVSTLSCTSSSKAEPSGPHRGGLQSSHGHLPVMWTALASYGKGFRMSAKTIWTPQAVSQVRPPLEGTPGSSWLRYNINIDILMKETSSASPWCTPFAHFQMLLGKSSGSQEQANERKFSSVTIRTRAEMHTPP